jgi:predicted adenylyl cyclase CyaB
MAYLNVEIKAKCDEPSSIRTYLETHKGEFRGTDHQTDTYFHVANGRLKLREGAIENNLIYYERKNVAGAKGSNFQLVKIQDTKALKDVLSRSLGIKVIVEKKREIYFIENVKFHIDEVRGLGNFMEIEASNLYAELAREELQRQCEFYLQELHIMNSDLVSVSYSDILL